MPNSPQLDRHFIGLLEVRMGLDGPSIPVRVEPLKYPEPEPRHEPAEAPPVAPTPEREPEGVPA